MSANIPDIFGSNAGQAQTRQGTTIQTFLISLAAGFVLFGVQFGTFLIVRNYLWAKRIYQPRSFLIPLKNRLKPPPNNPFRWFVKVLSIRVETEVRQKAGMDAYFFLRYLAMCLKIFLPLVIFVIPILIPLNVVDGKDRNPPFNVTGLDTMAWSNVSPDHTSRYWAHVILAIITIVWVCFLFHQELMHYIVVRQEYLASQSHRLKASSTTVLITDIPQDLCTPTSLTKLYDDFPGGVRRIWINRNYDQIVRKDDQRKWFEDRLENAETDLVRHVIQQHRKQQKKRSSTQDHADAEEMVPPQAHTAQPTPTRTDTDSTTQKSSHKHATLSDCKNDLAHDIRTKAAWTRYVKPGQRSTMYIPRSGHEVVARVPLLGRVFSDKVDTIYYCRRELARLNQELEVEIEQSETHPLNMSAFIQFNTQKGAHLACQAVADPLPRRMAQRSVEISPADINWRSLNYSWRNRAVRLVVFLVLFGLVLAVYGLISFFTGVLSRVSTLADTTSWLRWIGTLPSWLLSFIQGTLPPVIQVIVMSGPTPIVLRALTNSTRGATTGSQGERSLQFWYFIFLLTEILIIPTISTGLTSVVQELIHSPTSVPEILATNLPTASNYYFSFLIVQALSISSSSILQTVRLLNYYVFGSANTPDSIFAKNSFTHLTRIGSNIPWYTVFAIIGMVYCIIAPLMIIFVLITFGLFFFVIKNNLLYVVRTGNVDSGGVWFPSAIGQTFTGIYFMEFCLIGLLFLVRDAHGEVACQAQGIIMTVCAVLTIFYQSWLSANFRGLLLYAPLRLEGSDQDHISAGEVQPLDPEKVANTPSTRRGTVSRDRKPVVPFAPLPRTPTGTTTAAAASTTTPGGSSRPVDDKTLQPLEQTPSDARSVATLSRTEGMQMQQELDKEDAKRILARINRPLDEKRLAELEERQSAGLSHEGHSRPAIIPHRKDIEARMMNDPISKIIMQHYDELEDLDASERDMLVSVAFTHPLLREPTPVVWIPADDLGVSDDEVRRTRELSQHIMIDNRGAFFNRKLKVRVDRPPPDMSEFALVMAEL